MMHIFCLPYSLISTYVFSAGLKEHQHTHKAPHSLSAVRTEEMAVINAPELHTDHDRDSVLHVTPAALLGDLTEEEGHGEEWLQTLMGLSLLLGFIFMLFVDQIGGGHSHAPSSGQHVVSSLPCPSTYVPHK